MEPDNLLVCPQKPTICPFLSQINPRPFILRLEDQF
jgi:hypothetical protein